jgi:hypothetical protein
VYNMYSWDQPASSAGEHPGRAATATAGPAAHHTDQHHGDQRTSDQRTNSEHRHGGRRDGRHATPAAGGAAQTLASPAHAVQVALDRRDNGGDAAPGRGVLTRPR